MSKVKVVAKYFAYSKAKPKSGPLDGDFDSPDIVEAERFEIFFPKDGLPSKAEYVNKIRESGDLNTVEKTFFGKSGNVVKFYKFHQKTRVVLNSKEQFDDLLENVKGNPGDPRLHIKLIPEAVLWKIGPGGKLGISGANEVNKGKPSKNEMRDSLLIDQKVKDIKSLLVKEKVNDCNVYRSGDHIYIFCKCGKHIKAKPGRGAKSSVTAFLYEHYTPKHRVEESDVSDDEEERLAKRQKKNMRGKKKEAAKEKDSSDESETGDVSGSEKEASPSRESSADETAGASSQS